MRLLRAVPSVIVSTLALLALAALTPAVMAHPPHEPDHGVNDSVACTLWAADEDVTNETTYTKRIEDVDAEVCQLAPVTDLPLDAPPAAVEQWNDGDVKNFPATGADRSAYPANTSLEDGRFVRDAYARLFAIQPSTRAHLSADERPFYAAPTGTVSGTVDYRVMVPAGDSQGTSRVSWALRSHAIRETRLEIDGTTVARAPGSQTPTFQYDLESVSGEEHTIGLVAEIEAELSKRTKRCVGNYTNGTCDDWAVSYSSHDETIIVRDTRDVVEYDLAVAGYRTRYPDGDLGLVLYKNYPWLGYSLPDGDVRGVWRFYAARDGDWDTLMTANNSGQTAKHSPLHPLQVHAYPFEPGPTASTSPSVSIMQTFGSKVVPPALPKTVHLDVLTEPYVASYGIATRTTTLDHDLSAVVAQGLVRGVTYDVTPETILDVPVKRTNLTLSIRNATDEMVSVEVALREGASGAPIETEQRDGYVLIEDQRVNTSANGTAMTSLPRPAGGITARFEPGRWWRAETGYVGDTAVVSIAGAELAFVSLLFEVGLPVSLFLLAVFIVDRMTGWRVWPPWRVG